MPITHLSRLNEAEDTAFQEAGETATEPLESIVAHLAVRRRVNWARLGGSFALITAPMATLACSAGNTMRSRYNVHRDTISDTITVHTTRGSVWGGDAQLVEHLRIGDLEGPETYTFGDVVEMTSDGHGGVYVFDRQIPAIRHYDNTGQYVGTIGRRGSGPGEYGGAVLGLARRHDGSMLAHDVQNQRINVYDSTGQPTDHWRVISSLYASRTLSIDSLGNMYVKVLTSRRLPGQPRQWPWPIGLVRLSADGAVVDTLEPPMLPGTEPDYTGPLGPQRIWTMEPAITVVGINDRLAFEIRRGDTTIRASRVYQPATLSDVEWEAYEARREWQSRREPDDQLPATPRLKPAYHSFDIDGLGRIWVRKYMPVEPVAVPQSEPGAPPPIPFIEPEGYDVFDPDGSYLGSVSVPRGTSVRWFGTDHLFGIHRGDFDEQYVVRLVLKMPDAR